MTAQDRSKQREPRHASVNQRSAHAELDPDAALLQAIADAAPENPLHTPAFAHAQRLRGRRVVGFLSSAAQTRVGCTGFVSQGRLHRDLEIPSAPAAHPDHPIWEAIGHFCSDVGVTRLRVQSLGSRNKHIPCLGRTLSRSPRREYVLELRATPLLSMPLSSNHRRNVRRAERSGVHVNETADPNDSETHAGLIDFSMSRRQKKGEQAFTGTAPDSFHCLLQAGAGVIFQAKTTEGTVVSSLLVLLSERGAYYHSAGTSPAGMRSGASQFLVAMAADRLRGRKIDVFNLGGATAEQDGLARFKSGFGASPVELEAASFDVASGPRRGVVVIAEGLRSFLGR